MNKLEKMARKLNEEYRNVLAKEMMKRYEIEIETHYNFATDEIASSRVDGLDFTPEQKQFATAFGDGFAAAMGMVIMDSQ